MTMDSGRSARRVAIFAAGAVLLVGSALLALSILLAVFPLAAVSSSLVAPGVLLYGAYGLSSFLVPVFFLAAAVLLLVSITTLRGVFLLGFSCVPFFTVVVAERLCRSLSGGTSVVLPIVLGGVVASAALLVCLEYLVASFLYDKIAAPRGNVPIVPIGSIGPIVPITPITPIVPIGPIGQTDPLDRLGVHEWFDESAMADQVMANSAMSDSAVALEAEHDQLEVDTDGLEGESQMHDMPNHDDSQYHEDEVPASSNDEPKPCHKAVCDEGYGEVQPKSAPFDLPSSASWAIADGERATAEAELGDEDASEPEYLEPAFDLDAFAERDGGVDIAFDDDEPTISDDLDAGAYDVDAADAELDEVDDIDAEIEDVDGVDDEDDEYGDVADAEGDTDAALVDLAIPEAVSVPPAPREEVPVRKKRRGEYAVPYDVLNSYPDGEYWIIDDTTRRAAVALKETLNEFRIQADVTGIRKGPVITMFEILPAPGVKLSKIVGLQDNIALRLAASSVRIVAPIPGKHAVGIEVPNQKRAIVSFRELIETETPSAKKMEIPVVLGKDITGEAQLLDLASTPHLLIAGSTGSGKSVCVNSIILSILYKRSPEDVKLILIDPKIVELKLYNDIGHLLAPVITEPKKAFQALQYGLCEMERRYALLDGMGVRDIKSYNRRIKERNIATEKLPYIVIIIDEFADLMATTGKELESTVARLCAMSRAVGIHLVLATQRPSIDVITGLIKANIPTRIAFMVASKMDSRIIIDQVGAEKLLGRGDMLYSSATDPFPVRIQGAYVSEEEVERVVERVKALGEPEYIDEEIFVEDDDDDGAIDASLFGDGEDPLYDKALEIVLLAGKASASYIQRKLKIGYNRAARLVEDMEARGIVGPANGSKPREVVHHP